jgi:tripartite-type tricarboxylate transporter receptor subunit TctC
MLFSRLRAAASGEMEWMYAYIDFLGRNRDMKFVKASTFAILAGALVTAGLASSASAQAFKGKRVNIIINYGAGGNTDIQGRMVIRHMKKFVAGEPRFIFRHVSGAGGVVGANFLGEAGKTNGTMMGVFTIPIMAQIMKAPEMRVDLRDFQMVGAIAQQTISHIRVDAIPGMKIKSYKDLLHTKHPIRTGGHGPASSKDLRTRMFFETLQIPLKHVTGYKTGGKIRAAILKNELDMTADSVAGYFGRVVPQLIKTGISVPVWHVGHPTPDGGMKCSHTVPKEIPCFAQVYEEKFGKGKRPAKLYWDALRTIAGTRELLRIIVFRKGTPKKYVDEMREAWKKTMANAEFQKEYKKANGSDLVGMEGQKAQDFLRSVVTVPPALQKFLLDYANAARS